MPRRPPPGLGAADADAAIDRWYPVLLAHRTLPAAAAHLAAAGGDLDRLTVDRALYRSLYPLNAILPVPAPGDRVPLSSVLAALERHQRLLGAVVADVVGAFPDDVVALFGRAIRLSHPWYRSRVDHDVDLFVPDVATGFRVTDHLASRGFVLQNVRTSRVGDRWLAHLSAFRLSEEGHRLYVDVLAGGRPSGPRLRPPWVADGLAERARRVAGEGVEVLVPSPADDLVLLADKALARKAPDFTRRHANDARVVLAGADGLDAGVLVAEVARAGTAAALAWFVADAEAAEGRPLVTPAVAAALAADPVGDALVAAAVAASAASPGKAGQGGGVGRAAGPAEAAMDRLGRRWVRHYVATSPSAAAAVAGLAADRARRSAQQVGVRAARAPLARLLRRLDPGHPRSVVVATVPRRAPGQASTRTNLPTDGTPSGETRNSR